MKAEQIRKTKELLNDFKSEMHEKCFNLPLEEKVATIRCLSEKYNKIQTSENYRDVETNRIYDIVWDIFGCSIISSIDKVYEEIESEIKRLDNTPVEDD